MASFKLGRIKGDRGEKGADGAKGERGDAGVRGDAGSIPVFTVNSVEDAPYGASASVEIDSADPENPKLTFRIPKGKDGKDALGDMASDIYDTEGRKTDIYKFVNAVFENAFPKSGGSISGKLFVHQSPGSEPCVRNISFATSLPENAVEGDICFLTADDYENTIYSNGVGSVILIPEGDEICEYIVAATDYHGEGTATLIRKKLPEFTECFNFSIKDNYYCSNVDYFLEGMYSNLYPGYIRKMMKAPTLEKHKRRHCFLPSVEELYNMAFFKNNSAGVKNENGVGRTYMTRSLDEKHSVNCVNSKGSFITSSQKEYLSVRPVIVVDGNLVVRNSVYNGNSVVEPVVSERIYHYDKGQWKELMS